MALFVRKESPPAYSDHRKYVPSLRRDFRFRCAYCERTEEYLGGEEAFEVDHFKPEQKFPELKSVYANLYYCCRKCNANKWKTWPSEAQTEKGAIFADPCTEDPYISHLRENADGGLDELTACGTYSNAHIRLDRPSVREWRQRRKRARNDLRTLRSLEDDLVRLMDFAGQPSVREIESQLEAIRRLIEETQRRFLVP